MSTTRHKNGAFAAIHASAKALRKVGAIDKATTRDFGERCIAVPPQFKPEAVRQLRDANNVSPPLFARFLNTSESTVEKWETRAKRPSGMACKLLAVVQKHGLQDLV